MNIKYGYESYLKTIGQMKSDTKKEQWFEYYLIYKDVFDTIFKYLYMKPVDSMLEIVEHTNFSKITVQADFGIHNSELLRLEETLKACSNYYEFKKIFNLYVLVGIGHIDGTALPSKTPFIYLGLERLQDRDIELLIQHEFNHMVRFCDSSEFMTATKLTVGQLVVAEGLATLAPLAMKNEILSEEALAKALFMKNIEYEKLKNNYNNIERSIIRDFDKELSPKLMSKYFMKNGGEFDRAGYFYGMTIIKTLMDKKKSLPELTYMDTRTIMYYFSKN
ncbi:DUF2268 domain-containing putative Zn-dependent protease [Salinicoccus sesuvii]|uniref:DUF2268 domain-containing putative Zn-dependent protease n=1 Tax=Salinicoccus sesuvii TaxID=868281 RepID=A0ABV7N7Y4_9STAP